MNKFLGVGRLTADPKITTTQGKDGELTIARYNLAIDRRGKDAGADFLSCVCFGKVAEFVEKYLHKGTKVAIEGRVQTGSYENKDGKKVYTTDIVVEAHEFCEKASNTEAKQTADDFMDVSGDDDGLPFN